MAVNNFKELEREHIARYNQNTNRISNNLNSELRSYKFIGSIFELFSTTAISFLVSMTGVETKKKSSKKPKKAKKKYPNK